MRVARKKRAAIARKKLALELLKNPVEKKPLPPRAKALIKARGKGKITAYAPKYTHRSSQDKINRPDVVPVKDHSARVEKLKYTGDKLLGVALMHKSNYAPVFSHEDAISITKMRRN
jgi:hypothetical protein